MGFEYRIFLKSCPYGNIYIIKTLTIISLIMKWTRSYQRHSTYVRYIGKPVAFSKIKISKIKISNNKISKKIKSLKCQNLEYGKPNARLHKFAFLEYSFTKHKFINIRLQMQKALMVDMKFKNTGFIFIMIYIMKLISRMFNNIGDKT